MTAKKTRTPKKAKEIAIPVEGKQADALRPQGRPTQWTIDIAKEICTRLALGETLNEICADERMPSRPTVVRWNLEDYNGFSDMYARGRDMLLDHWADEIVTISDHGVNDYMKRLNASGDEVWVPNPELVNRSKLRVDSRRWLLSKLRPERYGDKLELNGNGASPIIPVVNVTIAGKQANSSQPRLTREAGNSLTNRSH